tara:strand:- start:364 stop:534 length:171 start_codon:yes stop_codon:yes gene_type:complete
LQRFPENAVELAQDFSEGEKEIGRFQRLIAYVLVRNAKTGKQHKIVERIADITDSK